MMMMKMMMPLLLLPLLLLPLLLLLLPHLRTTALQPLSVFGRAPAIFTHAYCMRCVTTTSKLRL